MGKKKPNDTHEDGENNDNDQETTDAKVDTSSGAVSLAPAKTDQSRLGKLTSAILNKILVPREFENLLESGAIKIDQGKIPLSLMSSERDENKVQTEFSLSSMLGSIIAGHPELAGDFADYTQQDLQNAIVQAASSHRKDGSSVNYTKPPVNFGNATITEDDLSRLSQLRKLDNNKENVIRILESCTMFHNLSGAKFSKPEFLRLVQLSLPNRAHETCSAACHSSNYDPEQVFRILSLRFDTRKSKDAVLHELQKVGTSDLSLLESFEKIHDLIIHLRDKSIDIDSRCFEECLRLLKARVSPTTYCTIKTMLKDHKNEHSFYTLYAICKEFFAEDPALTDRPSNNKKVSQIVAEATGSDDSKVDKDLKELKELVTSLKVSNVGQKDNEKDSKSKSKNKNKNKAKSTKSKSQKQKQNANVQCFKCGQNGHYSNNCTQQVSSNATEYASAPCAIHGNGHTNKACTAQRSPCTFAPNHSNHLASDCRRPLNARPRAQAVQYQHQTPYLTPPPANMQGVQQVGQVANYRPSAPMIPGLSYPLPYAASATGQIQAVSNFASANQQQPMLAVTNEQQSVDNLRARLRQVLDEK